MTLGFLSPAPESKKLACWKILIVDDEPDVHTVTKLALKRFELDEKGLEFISAFSAAEAKEVIQSEHDIALIFLDVVMESDDAGLQFANWLRIEHKNKHTRIILRTGQPGQAPEEDVIMKYDINDYKQKTELDRKRLFTTVVTALRAYRDIIEIEVSRKYEQEYKNGLKTVIEATASVLEEKKLPNFFQGLLHQIVSILRIRQEGAMLHVLKGAGTIFNSDDYKVIAQFGNNENQPLTEQVRKLLNVSRELKESVYEDGIYVAYLPTTSDIESLIYLNGVDVDQVKEMDIQLLHLFCANVGIALDNLQLNNEIINTQSELINRLGNAVESRSKESGNHIKRMAIFSEIIARQMGLSENECEVLALATPMHDIGKIATPDSILLKPGKLDDDEFEIMRQHAMQGYEILAGSEMPIIKAASIIAQQHHEKFDGSGYPLGLKGEEIHLYARIVAVADVFDALAHARCYKPAWPLEKVLELLKSEKGKHFDPQVVDALFDSLDDILEENKKYIDAE
ncbi:MAG: DUF3369 domain-containing protein [Gammaproteobacteria bacterium]|nr:DUF3369 domain-containing protein [Gammaproteobacteria bacterium]